VGAKRKGEEEKLAGHKRPQDGQAQQTRERTTGKELLQGGKKEKQLGNPVTIQENRQEGGRENEKLVVQDAGKERGKSAKSKMNKKNLKITKHNIRDQFNSEKRGREEQKDEKEKAKPEGEWSEK